jgi:hypothetical protein
MIVPFANQVVRTTSVGSYTCAAGRERVMPVTARSFFAPARRESSMRREPELKVKLEEMAADEAGHASKLRRLLRVM